jgi:hypothetical protein
LFIILVIGILIILFSNQTLPDNLLQLLPAFLKIYLLLLLIGILNGLFRNRDQRFLNLPPFLLLLLGGVELVRIFLRGVIGLLVRDLRLFVEVVPVFDVDQDRLRKAETHFFQVDIDQSACHFAPVEREVHLFGLIVH